MDLSIIVPLLNEAESIPELFAWIGRVMKQNNFSYEVIFVDDGSTDDSWKIIEGLKADNPEIVKGIKFRRNYGKSPALFCGFDMAQGDIVVTMDADLQDSPDEVPEMVRMIREDGFDLVSGWKKKRYDGKFSKNIPSKIYNWTARKVTGIHLHDMNCGLKAYRREVVKNIEVYGEMHRYIPFLAKNAGFGKIGEKCNILPPFRCDYGFHIEVGENFFANYNFIVLDGNYVRIGDNVWIAPNVGIYAAGHPLDVEDRIAGEEYAFPVTIGDNVWIGGGVTIIGGVTIGKNAVVAAGSVVIRDVPPDTLVAGNPARVIRKITAADKNKYPRQA